MDTQNTLQNELRFTLTRAWLAAMVDLGPASPLDIFKIVVTTIVTVMHEQFTDFAESRDALLGPAVLTMTRAMIISGMAPDDARAALAEVMEIHDGAPELSPEMRGFAEQMNRTGGQGRQTCDHPECALVPDRRSDDELPN